MDTTYTTDTMATGYRLHDGSMVSVVPIVSVVY
jgi:hypothetical protein